MCKNRMDYYDSFCNSSHNFQSLTSKSMICESSHKIKSYNRVVEKSIIQINNTVLIDVFIQKKLMEIHFSLTLINF
ncbi:hypothetical protein FF021_03465 [Leptospira noguchii]|nr:hypothetical protein FF021_03465 [Leptospira noguchii]